VLRAEVVQGFLDAYPAPRYLEIGVNEGATFHALKAARRVAVDPAFLFDVGAARAEHPDAAYHATTSDDFFARVADPAERFDVVYLDGLHTFEQTLRDLLNALAFTHPASVIVVDDVLPNAYASSLPDMAEVFRLRAATGDPDPAWMGDVFRLVYFVAAFLPAFSYATVADNHGQLVLWRGARAVEHPSTVEAVARRTFLDSVLDRAPFRLRPYAEIRAEALATLGLRLREDCD
jgi:hypothetical protein